jgi:flagellar M-ring protein FliF
MVVDRFRSLPAERQWVLALTLAAVIAAAAFVVYGAMFQTHYGVLVSNLRPADAATTLAELDKKKVPYQLRDGGQTILVPTDMVDRARIDVLSGDLPLKGTVGFELFNKSDMGVTEFAQKINYQRALQGELERTLMAMDNVEEARVHLALSEPSIFRDDQKPPKASVTVFSKSKDALPGGTITGIQRLVAAAVPDLDPANVVVLDNHGEVVSHNGEADGVTGADQDTPQAVEDRYENKLRQALNQLYPSGGFDVSVSAGYAPSPALPDPMAARNYPLRVAVIVAGALSPDKESAIRSLVLREIRANPNLGDSISVAAAPLLAPAVPPPSQRSPFPFDVRTAVFTALACVVLAFGLIFGRNRSGPRTLTPQQRQAFAARLKSALEEAKADAL